MASSSGRNWGHMAAMNQYKQVFCDVFSITLDKFSESIAYQSIDEWDSIGHMSLISALESEFEIVIEMDDVIDFESFNKGIEILKKYKIFIQ